MFLHFPQPRVVHHPVAAQRQNSTLQSVFPGNSYVGSIADRMQVRKGANPTRVYLEQDEKDATGHSFSTEADSFFPVQGGDASSPYTIWTANLTEPGLDRYVVAEIDGAKVEMGPLQALIALPPCPGL